ncbi:polyprenyl synthetase family protein [Streptomyces lavendulae]|uniref:polyprenyl synthetase family protein n=1 Tax=Streptomyces lavendulae TaxID=1914 RepID=UPI00249FF2C2|nr:polyprenyl synthetase family protein [Streptomyces lavendulae]GLX19502.1 hypothetical protein Slala01_31460 [Streptomyces lavendulae subsp. lavendulae]GLX26997.1 hypothetical protein Slala02_28170 [Streptomyces lavendulae subsp. lavendulae]
MPIPLSSVPAAPGAADGLDLDRIRDRTAAIVTEFFSTRTGPLARPLREATEGGKMFRPVLCTVGWHAAGGPPADDPALHLGASLELFHASLLIHDDICDQADTRRGRPASTGRWRPRTPAPVPASPWWPAICWPSGTRRSSSWLP